MKAVASVAKMDAGSNEVSKPATGSWLERTKEYFADLKAEMHKVTWPSWKQVRATTAVVLAAIFAFAAYFAVVDLLLGRAIQRVFDTFTK